MMISDGFVLPPFREQNLEIVEWRIISYYRLAKVLSRKLLVIRSYLVSRVSTSVKAEPRLMYRFTNFLPGHHHYPSVLSLCLAKS
jgi:hypothetical protein